MYSKDILRLHKNLGLMHPQVFNYIATRNGSYRRSGKTTRNCMQAAIDISKGRDVIFIIPFIHGGMRIRNIILEALNRGLKINRATCLSLVNDKLRVVDSYTKCDRYLRKGSGATTIIRDLD